ncbi:MAG: acyltransferase [Clostridia bacterium]|nr:acyltransferase [Clostridia bacterium]
MASYSEKGRIPWVERLQVLCMLLVVVHHCVPNSYSGPEVLERLLDTLHYPALAGFFLASGLFAGKWRQDGWRVYLKKRFLRLMTPYFCINLLMLAPRYGASVLMGVQPDLSLEWLVLSLLDPHEEGIAPHLWFLPTLMIMSTMLPVLDVLVCGKRAPRLATLAVLLTLSLLPLTLPTLLCLDELKLYLFWFALGLAVGKTWDIRRFLLTNSCAMALGVTGSMLFAAQVAWPELPLTLFSTTVSGLLALLAACVPSRGTDALAAAFRGRTFNIYVLSMCVQNMVEVLGALCHVPWAITALAMLILGLALPWCFCAWEARHPLPRPLRLAVGL